MTGRLYLDVDLAQLHQAGAELGATTKQVRFAVTRAAQRTASTLRAMSARGLADELQLRTIALLRRRLKTLRVRNVDSGTSLQLWYGLNPMPASWFKGRPRKTAAGAEKRGQQFPGAFIARSNIKGRQTIFKRSTSRRLPIAEQNLEVQDQAIVFIEDEIFAQVDEIFWRNFTRDLSARVRFDIGEK